MLAAGVCLVAGKHGAFDGRSREGNAVTLGSKVSSRDTEFYTVQPVILVLAVGFLRTETDSNRSAAIFAAGNQHMVIVDGSAGQHRSSGSTNIINAQSQSAGLKLLHDFSSAIVRIERSLSQLHGKLCRDCLCQLDRSVVGFLASFVLGNGCIIQFIKTNRSHNQSSNS